MSFPALLENKHEYLRRLTALLRQEQSLLVQGQPDGQLLLQIAADKQPLLQTLEQIEALQRGLVHKLGLSDPAHAAAFSGCLQLWQAIQSEAELAAHLNRLNGTLVQQTLEHNQRALNTLQELAGDVVYDANGRPSGTRNGISSIA